MKYINKELRGICFSLFEVAHSSGELDKVNQGVNILQSEFIKHKDFLQKVHFATANKIFRMEVMSAILKPLSISSLLCKLLLLLTEKGKVYFIKAFLDAWPELQMIYSGYIKVELTTSDVLTEGQLKKTEKHLSSVYGDKFFLNKVVDQSIIGGMILRVNGFVYDNSILGKLKKVSSGIKG